MNITITKQYSITFTSNNMDSNQKIAHAIFLPFPLQSHIKAMLKLAKLLHHKGFHITFVNTEYNHKRFLKSASPGDHSLGGARFGFETIPDGLPPASNPDVSQDILSLAESVRKNFLAPFLELVSEINDKARSEANGTTSHDVASPPVSCFVADSFMSFVAGPAARELGVPLVQFFPISACGMLGMQQYRPLVEKGLLPLKDESCMTNGYLDTILDGVPGMKGFRLRDLPSFCRTTNVEDILFNYCIETLELIHEASSIVIQTFDALERGVLDALSAKIPNLYTIGPLQLLLNNLTEDSLKPIQYNLWKEETECLKWLDAQTSKSVVYVNFGSITVLTPQQVVEFGWGLANSNHSFMWVIRPDLVIGESACLSREFLDEVKERSLITSWCPQEDVLNHPSIGGFLMHCGWNSVIESLSSGVPFLSYPFFADQQTNCWWTCNEVGVSMEIDNNVKRSQVEELVRELMEGEKGEQMRSKAVEMKKLAKEATSPYGSSSRNLENLVRKLLCKNLTT